MRKKKTKTLISRGDIFFVLFMLAVIAAIGTWFQKPKMVMEVKTGYTTIPGEIIHGDKTKKEVIFTFDGGSGTQSGKKILSTLAKYHVKGSFFITGKMIEQYPSFVKSIVAAGHEIFNHTYDHEDLTTLSDVKIAEEFKKMGDLLYGLVGVYPKPYFRAPYGARDAQVLASAAKSGYRSVYWTVDALDWQEQAGETDASVRDRILYMLAPGNIYLMHIGDNITGDILDSVFNTIESRGYKIVSLSEGLR